MKAKGGTHYEDRVNVNNWKWRGKGPYTINFIAKDLQGNTLAQKSITIVRR